MRLILWKLAFVIFSKSVFASDVFTERVSEMWAAGNKEEVLNIAKERLRVNSRDIAGLLLKFEYEVEVLDTKNLPDTIAKLEKASGGITTKQFKAQAANLKSNLDITTKILGQLSNSELERERQTSTQSGKVLSTLDFLRAAERDGLIRMPIIKKRR